MKKILMLILFLSIKVYCQTDVFIAGLPAVSTIDGTYLFITESPTTTYKMTLAVFRTLYLDTAFVRMQTNQYIFGKKRFMDSVSFRGNVYAYGNLDFSDATNLIVPAALGSAEGSIAYLNDKIVYRNIGGDVDTLLSALGNSDSLLTKHNTWTNLNEWTQDSLKINGLWYDFPGTRIANSVLYDSLGNGILKWKAFISADSAIYATRYYTGQTYKAKSDSTALTGYATNYDLLAKLNKADSTAITGYATQYDILNKIALTSLSSTATGLTYTNTTGVFSLTAGYVIPTTTEQTNWGTAYTNRITSLTTTGSSGASTLISNTLNVPQYTLAGLGGIGLSSLSGTAPITYNNGTGAIGLDQTANYSWSGTHTMTGTFKSTGAAEGANGYVLNSSGIFGYSATLGTVFSLPTSGAAPTFSSGIINSTVFNLYTASVIRTSATVGDGSASSAGVLMNDTGVYGVGANQLTANANFKLLSATGLLTATGVTLTGAINAESGKFGTATNYWSVGATGLTATSASTDVMINYGKTDFAQDATAGFILGYDYSASKSKFEIGSGATKLFKFDGTDLSLTGGTITGGTIQTAASGDRAVLNSSGLILYGASDANKLTLNYGTDPYLNFTYGAVNYGNIKISTYYTAAATQNYSIGTTGDFGVAGTLASVDLYVKTSLRVGGDKFLANSTGQLTTINNIAASGVTGQALVSDGTSYTPTAIPLLGGNNALTGNNTTTGSVMLDGELESSPGTDPYNLSITGKNTVILYMADAYTVNLTNPTDGQMLFVSVDKDSPADAIISPVRNGANTTLTLAIGKSVFMRYRSSESTWYSTGQ